jgi:hypothetical protein
MLLCSPISVSLCLHLLVHSNLLLFSTSTFHPSFTVSAMHLCSFLLPRFMLCVLFWFYELRLFYLFHLLPTACYFPRVIPLHNNLHHLSVMNIYTICETYSSSMHSASTCSSSCHGSTHAVVHCHSTSPPLNSLEHEHTLSVLHVILVSSPLPDHHGNSSVFPAAMPMRSSSLGVMLRFLSMSSSQDSSSFLS